MTNEEAVKICMNYLLRVFNYPDLEKWQQAKSDAQYTDIAEDIEKIKELIMFASHAGTVLRLAYYHLVHKQGIDVRLLFDAVVKVYTFQGIYQHQLERFVNKGHFKQMINSTRHPFWTKFGLIGGGIKELSDEGKKFSKYMDELKEAEDY